MIRVLGRERASNGIREMNLFGLFEDGFLIPFPFWILVQDFPFLRLVGRSRCSVDISRIGFCLANLAIFRSPTCLCFLSLPTTFKPQRFRGLGSGLCLVLSPRIPAGLGRT